MKQPKYTYSQLSSDSVSDLVSSQYDLPSIISCKFYVLGLHDNYLVESESEKYIFRIYRNDWRTRPEIQFELDLLAFIGTAGEFIAEPVTTNSSGLSFIIDSPEGKRSAALFHFADGYAPEKDITTEQSTLLGKAVANVHQITDIYETRFSKDILDIPYLLDDSIIAITPFIDTETRNYLYTLQNKLKDALSPIFREGGVFGICLGDVNLHNFHINENNKITLFDFDQCGYGYRAFEIGKYLSSIHSLKNKDGIGSAFVEGYQQVRELSKTELYAVPYYEIVAVIWVMAIHAYNPNLIGYKRLEKPYWDRQLAILKELDKLLANRVAEGL